ncbi:MAG: thioether cross-link-forming SCIFF peptide maturase [Oscillospiraceae bacterium]|jgi:uncharacterized protein|nr:thioether cross-link-forming SCIFF peptide maturase [Oscillospiraceae bacterium]
MIHTFSGLGGHFVLDAESGAVHQLDELGLALLTRVGPEGPMTDVCPPAILAALSRVWPPEEIAEGWDELRQLRDRGELFTPAEAYRAPEAGRLKALCLHVAHDCDLRCGYCFAGTGHYGGARGLMPFETARAAIDLLAARSGGRRNLEVDFFGGEPLLALDTVKQTVAYARAHETEWGKRFRFTLTTNGLALDADNIAWLDAEMDNLVLSLDGRPNVNDAVRKTPTGAGSYEKILPGLLAAARAREASGKDYYVRGTFTARNPDFVDDLLHLAELGFRHLSMEPVVLPEGHPLALREEHVPTVLAAYDRLLAIMRERGDFSFFHFNIDLDGGPCVYKRLRGCGAGFEYAAVSPEGEVYPCHQFVGKAGFRLGDVWGGSWDDALSGRFAALTVETKPDCAVCWAKYFCSGGCAAAAVNLNGRMDKPYGLGCALQRKRLECALVLKLRD